jgi:ketosteroid isomerase-like protein
LFAVTEVVRTALGSDVRLRTRRSLDERLFVRWPRTFQVLARAVLLLPPRSRLRRALLRRSVLSGWSAWSRGDLDLMLVRYAPDYQSVFAPEFVTVGLSSSYRGHAGIREWTADLSEAWGEMEVTLNEIVDAGDRLVNLGRFCARGRGSGVELDSPTGQAVWFERGLVARERVFFDWDEALAAAGLPTNAPGDLDLAADAGTVAAPD